MHGLSAVGGAVAVTSTCVVFAVVTISILLLSIGSASCAGCLALSGASTVLFATLAQAFEFVDRFGNERVRKGRLRRQSLVGLPLNAFLKSQFELLTSMKSTKSESLQFNKLVRLFP